MLSLPAIFGPVMGVEKATLDQLRIDRKTPSEGGRGGWIGLLILLLLLAAGAAVYWKYGRAQGRQVTTAVAREISTGEQRTVLNASGYVTARRKATVSSKVTGKLTEVLIEEGMIVQEGQVLARLDTSNVETNLKLTEAQWQVARAAVEETRIRLQEAAIELKRVSSLVEAKISTPSDLDSAQAEVSALQARLDRQTQEIIVAERQIGLWKQELEDRVIKAPFAGVVISKDAQPGEMISPVSAGGGFTRTGICTIVDMGSLEIEVDVNESYINRVQPDQPVEAALDAYPDGKIPCKVIAIIPTADRQKATVKVRISFDQLDPKILPDMGVKVAFRDAIAENGGTQTSVVISRTAVRRENGQPLLFVVRDGRAERRAVTLGEERDGNMTVLGGLSAGERVVVEGPAELADGDAVREKTN